MIDFKRLLNSTPEERAEASRRANEEYELHTQAKIAERTEMIESLAALSDQLNENARAFVATLVYKARRQDTILRRMGGDLLSLSTAQVSYLEDLHRKVSDRPDQAASRVSPQGDAPRTRAERYGMRGA